MLFSFFCPATLVYQTVKNWPAMQETWAGSLVWEDPLEESMATHSSILAWRIQWTEEPGGLQSMGSQRVSHNWANNSIFYIFSKLSVHYLFILSHWSIQFSCSVVSDSLQHYGLQHTRIPCPLASPRGYSNSCPSSWWCHSTISFCLSLPDLNLFQHQGIF